MQQAVLGAAGNAQQGSTTHQSLSNPAQEQTISSIRHKNGMEQRFEGLPSS